jgi:hypothetical protein
VTTISVFTPRIEALTLEVRGKAGPGPDRP